MLDVADERGKAIILLLTSTGMRIGALSSLRFGHLQRIDEYDLYKVMQYAESFLSNNKADYAHNITVSFKNCMLRVPGSINSKNGQTVKLPQLWDGHFPKINPLLADFYIYLCGQRIKELTNQSNQLNRSRFGSKAYARDDGHGSYYQSISRYLRFTKTYFMSSPS